MIRKSSNLNTFFHILQVSSSLPCVNTVPTEHNLTPERTQSETGFVPWVRSWSALGSLVKQLRSLWVHSGFAMGSLCIRYLDAFYALVCEADPAVILSPTPVYSKHLRGSDFSHPWFCSKIKKTYTKI
jgi:hypothetical protein